MTEEELAALSVALGVLAGPSATPSPLDDSPLPSRWKIAARRPDLDMEDVRALY